MNIREMHQLASYNPFSSVCKAYEIREEGGLLLGVKNDFHIRPSFIQALTGSEKYQLHTIDVMAHGGRAVDLFLRNPITGKYMSGSSSGTAINVFLGINDIGIGTDGGGSVLAPAMCLQLFSFLSYGLDSEHMNQFSKKSTDNIVFRPSLGYISADYQKLEEIISSTVFLETRKAASITISTSDTTPYPFLTTPIAYPDIYGPREQGIAFLDAILPQVDFIISKEGPIDVEGFGDSIYGCTNVLPHVLHAWEFIHSLGKYID